MATRPQGSLLPESLQRDDPRPLHAQISDVIRERVTSGDWPPHYQLHSEPRLAEELQVSRGTVRRALKSLIEDGLLVQVHGKGTFVRPLRAEAPIAQEMLSLSEALEREGISLVTEVLDRVVVEPPRRIGALLDVDPDGEQVLYLARRRGDEDRWVALFDNYVRQVRCPGIAAADFARRKLFDVIEHDHGQRIAGARRSFAAVAADDRVAAALGCDEGTPVMHLEQVTYLVGGEPIEYSDVWILGDALRLSSFLRRI